MSQNGAFISKQQLNDEFLKCSDACEEMPEVEQTAA